MSKRISVLIVTKDRQAYLREALNSLLAQSYRNWEAIVVDNGSRCDVRRVVEQCRDSRIRFISRNANLGECGGRNLAFAHATGDFICYLDDDDLLPSDSLAARLAFYSLHPECGMVYGEYRRFRMAGDRIVDVNEPAAAPYLTKRYYDRLVMRVGFEPAPTYRFLKIFNFVRGGTPLIARETLQTVGLFDERLANHGDYELWLRIAARFPIRFLDHEVYLYRMHEGSTQANVREEVTERCIKLICVRHEIRWSLQFPHSSA